MPVLLVLLPGYQCPSVVFYLILRSYQSHYEQEVASLWLAVAWPGTVVVIGLCLWVLGAMSWEHLSPDDQLAHALLCCQGEETVVLAVERDVKQVLLGEVVRYQIALGLDTGRETYTSRDRDTEYTHTHR